MLAGRAARLRGPPTGGGILNGWLSGKYAGEIAAEASKPDSTEDLFQAYERRWRTRMEEELARHYLIKERLIRVDDETINKVIRAVSDIDVQRISTQSVLDAIRNRYPEVLQAFDGLL